MNPEIFILIEKGLVLLPTLVDAGIKITTQVQQLITLNKAASGGTPISDADLKKIRAEFDAALDDFNEDM
jgi:hypothetical protein